MEKRRPEGRRSPCRRADYIGIIGVSGGAAAARLTRRFVVLTLRRTTRRATRFRVPARFAVRRTALLTPRRATRLRTPARLTVRLTARLTRRRTTRRATPAPTRLRRRTPPAAALRRRATATPATTRRLRRRRATAPATAARLTRLRAIVLAMSPPHALRSRWRGFHASLWRPHQAALWAILDRVDRACPERADSHRWRPSKPLRTTNGSARMMTCCIQHNARPFRDVRAS
jgi:hypothetical protein